MSTMVDLSKEYLLPIKVEDVEASGNIIMDMCSLESKQEIILYNSDSIKFVDECTGIKRLGKEKFSILFTNDETSIVDRIILQNHLFNVIILPRVLFDDNRGILYVPFDYAKRIDLSSVMKEV